MKTIILQKPGELRAADTAMPGDPAPGWATVRVRRVGVCGTDWHAYRGRQPFFSYPRILGHELAVTVEAVNDPRSDLKPGDQCAVEPYLNCKNCIACRSGKPNCCANLKVLGVHVDGGMRERLAVPADKLHRSAKLSLDQLALIEPLGIGCHAVDRAGIGKGEWVLVLGAGPIGLSVIPLAAAAGGRVIVADVAASRLAWCEKMPGVAHTLNAADAQFIKILGELTGGDLPTVVFDATGNAGSMKRSFEFVAPGGRIVFVGLVQGEVAFDDPNFHRREVTLLATRNSRPEDFSRLIGMMERGELDTAAWITHRAGADELVDVFPRWAQPESGVLKAIAEF
jgi:2-desacetyl-2-hydroxyethyl bacteriochlorophyllide A dehydrogenase